LQTIRDFIPTVVIDSAFLTRDKLAVLGQGEFININQGLISDSLEMARLPSVRKNVGFPSGGYNSRASTGCCLKSEYVKVIT
jgi:hypothetical protein